MGGMRVTIEGVVFVSLSLLIGLAAVNTGENLLYLVLSVMLAMLLLSGAMASANLSRIGARRRYPPEVRPGQGTAGTVEVLNRKRWFHAYAIGVEDLATGPLHLRPPQRATYALRAFALAAPPGGQAAATVWIDLPRRGQYELAPLRLISRYPFGFFERARLVRDPERLLVYPPLLPLPLLLPHCAVLLGEIEHERQGMGSSLYGLRDYREGDPARNIHWKQSAKGTGVKIKEFAEEGGLRWRLMLDLRMPADPAPALSREFEKAVSVAATLAAMLIRQDAMTGLWTSMGHVPAGSGPLHLQRILRALALVQPQPPDAAPCPLDADSAQVSEIWIQYREPAGAAPRNGSARNGPARHILNVRPIADGAPVADGDPRTA
jgi:uncharacterized protein (DUF58 family)